MKEIYKNGLRFYQINDQELISVTSFIGAILAKKQILNWAISQTLKYIKERGKLTPEVLSNAYKYHSEYLKELGDIGTVKHKLVENYLAKEIITEDKFLDQFILWEKEVDFKAKYSEQFVYSEELKTAGRIDIIGYIFGVPFIVDLKSSSAIHSSHKIQICGYRILTGKPFNLGILRIDRTGKTKTWYVLTKKEIEIYSQVFLFLLEVFHLLYAQGDIK